MLAIVESTPLPVMLYDIPGRTGVAIGDEILDRLAEHPQVVAVKDATGDVAQGFDRMRRTGLEFYSGDDALNLAWLVHGGSGVVSVVGARRRPVPTPRWSPPSTPATSRQRATSPPGSPRCATPSWVADRAR